MGNIPEVVMVDDKVENRDQIRRSLEGLDIALIEINSFEDFFTRYLPGSKLPEILILDYFLEKGKTGKGLYIQMKSNFSESYKNVTVIGFSSIENCSKAIAVESGGIAILKDKDAQINEELRSVVESVSRSKSSNNNSQQGQVRNSK